MLLLSAVSLGLMLGAGPAPATASTEPQNGQDSMWEVLGHFDAYPNAQPYAVADSIEARGASFKTAGFATTDSPDQVLAFYRQEFAREGSSVYEQPPQMRQFLGLSTYDPATHIERTIVVLPGSGGPTRVMLSLSNGEQLLAAAQNKPGDQTDGLPIHPSGRPLRSDALDGKRRTTTISYHARISTTDFVAWLLPRLQEQQWVGDSASDDPAGQTLRFRRGSEALEVVIVAGPASSDVTYLHLH